MKRLWSTITITTTLGTVLAAGGVASPAGKSESACCCGMAQKTRGSGMGSNMADMRVARDLVWNHRSIQRSVRQLPNGVETVTTSTDPGVARQLLGHVTAMYARLREGRPLRGFDPLFVALFRNGDKIDAVVTPQANGVKVVETSKDAYAVKLIKAHAASVDRLVKEGMAAMHETTPAPPRH